MQRVIPEEVDIGPERGVPVDDVEMTSLRSFDLRLHGIPWGQVERFPLKRALEVADSRAVEHEDKVDIAGEAGISVDNGGDPSRDHVRDSCPLQGLDEEPDEVRGGHRPPGPVSALGLPLLGGRASERAPWQP